MNAHRRNRTGSQRAASGLSLFEVLIILIVLAVVAVILFPMLVRARDSRHYPSPGFTCQSNLKELAIALQTYWNDYDNHLPSSALVRGSKQWNAREFSTFATETGQLPPKSEERPVTWCQLLYPYMRIKDYMFCPSDSADHSQPGARSSYYWKAAIDKAWYGVQCTKPCQTEADFVYNADQIVFYEAGAFHDGGGPLKNDVQINVAYLDTHVKSVSIVNCPRKRHGATGWGEPAYFNFDNKKPRKDGVNPPPPDEAVRYVDPQRYSDMLP